MQNHELKGGNAMNRLIALAAGLVLSAFLTAPVPVSAAPDSASGNQQGGKQGQIKQTPKAAKDWHEREKKRSEAKKKAAAMKEQQLGK